MIESIICFFVGHKDLVLETEMEHHPEKGANRYLFYVLATLCTRCLRVKNNTVQKAMENG